MKKEKNMIIRKARREDVPALLDIYNDEVISNTATFDLREKTPEEWNVWYDAHQEKNYRLLVCEQDNVVTGYASLSAYREKEAYASTLELSVYIHQDYRRRGIATALMKEMIRLAKEDESVHTLISVITGDNTASIELHEKMGFSFAGRMHEVGFKHGRYLDIVNYELFT